MPEIVIHLDEVPALAEILQSRDPMVTFFVSVYNQPDLYVICEGSYVNIDKILELDKEQLEALVTSVVIDDNTSTFTQGGVYWPTSENSRRAFVELVNKARPLGKYTTEEETGNEQQN